MQSIITRLKAIIAGLAAAALTACSALQPQAQAPSPAPAPALWEVSDADSKIYLFGTIHLLPEGSNWRTPVLDAAIAASDALVTETLIGDDPAAQARLMMTIGVSPGLPPLVERVPEAKRAALAQTIADSGVPVATLDRLETWAAALVLSAAAFKKLGLDPKLGVERGLVADYDGEVRPKLGLETVEQQLGFFDGLSEASQRAFLESTLEDPTVARAEFQKM
ncbi:MAG: TraB/GumN family protein, partial [Pseudomonadota bacterium]|nr:TraB/GumN family protein [Pseudomonadota bacterium]